MPELPEVTTVARYLREKMENQIILKVNIYAPKMIKHINVDEFIKNTEGQKIVKVDNIAKYLFIHLQDFVLISHLRMEGKWLVEQKETYFYPMKHCLAELVFKDWFARYYDTRRFGTLECYPIDKYKQTKTFQRIGPVPMNGEVSIQYLLEKTQKSATPIKTLLLNQQIIAGLGNIYVNEVLFWAGVMPDRRSNSITEHEIELIIKHCDSVLNTAITMGGSSIHSYTSGEGFKGMYQNELMVHNRVNLPCKKCSQIIQKTKVGGRGTYYCIGCQK